MEIGSKVDIYNLKTQSRTLNVKEMIQFFQGHKQRFWCWGATAWTVITSHDEHVALRFLVSGLLFRGHVYVRCNGLDEMDVYFTTTRGTIVHKIENIGIENLFSCMDSIIERK